MTFFHEIGQNFAELGKGQLVVTQVADHLAQMEIACKAVG
jgi:hypothetical protein